MNNINSNSRLTQSQLEKLIEGYFDCTISESDEVLLRNELMHCQFSSHIIDEAKATILFFSVGAIQQKAEHPKRSIPLLLKVASAAAMIALVFTIGLYSVKHNSTNNVCAAYVNGHKIAEGDNVMSLISNDLNSIDEVSKELSNSIDQQMQDISLSCTDE